MKIPTVLLILSNLFVFNFFAQPTLEWVSGMGGSSNDWAFSLTTDASGNVYTAGRFEGTADFDPGVGIANLTSNGALDGFIQKLDANGNFLWAKQIGGTSVDLCEAIAIDIGGNVYVTGYFHGTVDFDPGVGTTNLTSNGAYDFYVLKLDLNGNLLWVTQTGSTGGDHGHSISTDMAGNVYTSGYFDNTVDFDPGVGVSNLTASTRQIFIQKLDANGNFVWAKHMVGNGIGYSHSSALDNFGNIYTLGYFYGTVDADPGVGTLNFNSLGNQDVFITKLDANGNLVWAKHIGGANTVQGKSLGVSASGNVSFVGSFAGTVDFDPGIGVSNFTPIGSSAGYLINLDSNGDFLSGEQIAGGNVQEVEIDSNGDIFTTGTFNGTTDFDPGVGVSNLTSIAGSDMYLQKLDGNGNLIWVEQFGGSSTVSAWAINVDLNNNIYAAGYFRNTPDFDPSAGTLNLTAIGERDVFVLKLSQCQPTVATDVQTACNTYDWVDGNTYASSNNTATWTLTNAAGCDSVVTLDLTVTYSTAGTDVQTACNTYDWIDGITYTASNNSATWTLTNATGCDSIVTLDLTINPMPSVNVTQSGSLLTVGQAGANYQWLDCDDNNAIVGGETNQSYTPTPIIGNYAVEVDLNGCVDTSACFLVDYTGFSEMYKDKLSLYPNPVDEKLTIEGLDELTGLIRIDVISASGKLESTIESMNSEINVSELATGVYFVSIVHEQGVELIRFIKK
ncbi:MAG: hypothetical protein COA38_02635 [Fluviicola sp.]|nr:MAG: hypothetical protein COA38_02635 [Fluviicola sp.]